MASRQDYIAAAAAIAAEAETADHRGRAALGRVAGRMAARFAADNERFDRERFFAACKVRPGQPVAA